MNRISLLVTAGWLTFAFAAVAEGRKGTCAPTGAYTLASSSLATVYRTEAGDYGDRWVGCWRRTGRRFVIAETTDSTFETGPEDDSFRLRGRFATYEQRSSERGGSGKASVIYLVNMYRRRPVAHAPAGRDLVAVRMTRTGKAGFLDRVHARLDGFPSDLYEVAVLWAHGKTTLDSGSKIDPTSLRLRDGILHWRNGGRARSARLANSQ